MRLTFATMTVLLPLLLGACGGGDDKRTVIVNPPPNTTVVIPPSGEPRTSPPGATTCCHGIQAKADRGRPAGRAPVRVAEAKRAPTANARVTGALEFMLA